MDPVVTYIEHVAANVASIRSMLNDIETAMNTGAIDDVHEIASEIADIALSIIDITETH